MANAGKGASGALSGAAAGTMIMPGIGTAIGGVVGGLAGLFSGDDVDTEALMKQAMAQFEGIVPPDLARAIVYQQFQQGGQLTPQQLSQLPIEAQQVVKLQENPEMRQKQMVQQQAMEQLAQTGMGAQERYALETTRQKSAQDAQARLQGLMQQYQQMGQAGSGGSLAAQLAGQQQAAQTESQANMQAAAMAAENRRNAIQGAMAGAGQMRQADLGVQESNVNAMRQRQMFDIQNAMGRQQANAQYANQANMMNLQRQQQIQDQNIQQANQEIYRRQYLAPQQMFANQMQMAGARAGMYGQQAQVGQVSNQAGAQNFGNIATGVMGAAGAYAQGVRADNAQDATNANNAANRDLYSQANNLGNYAPQPYAPASGYWNSYNRSTPTQWGLSSHNTLSNIDPFDMDYNKKAY